MLKDYFEQMRNGENVKFEQRYKQCGLSYYIYAINKSFIMRVVIDSPFLYPEKVMCDLVAKKALRVVKIELC